MVRPLKTRGKKKGASGASRWKLTGVLRALLLSALPYLLILSGLGVLFGSVFAYAVNSTTFELKEVRVMSAGSMTQAQAFEFCDLRPGENLVKLDLVNVQQVIKRRHPEYKEVRVKRVLPNRVEVVLRRRTPAAQIDYGRFVQVDKDLVILPGSGTAPFKNLTVIEGAPIPKAGLAVGVTISDANVRKAIKIAEIVKNSGILKGHSLSKVDVRDPKNFSLIVDGDVEVRLGDTRHLGERLRLLEQTLKTVGLDRSKVRYIDLRFDDVVIGPR
jgi:cell division septal protein FtsQ